ncbi:MAG: outer membrane protein assembly factor BamC [Pseudomonadota bacterium]
MAQRSIAPRRIIYALALVGLAGCSSVNSLMEPDRIDYKSAGKAPSLEVPPDLTQLQRENRYAVVETNRGTATASGFNLQQSAAPAAAAVVIAPKITAEARIERAGNQRWMVIKQSPELLWPQIKDFWQDSGFLINLETPEAGVMETDWAENRAKIPQDFIRNTLGRVLDSLYSTGERDKFRTRLERNADGSTEVYISHRGATEVVSGNLKDSTIWTSRPSDPELEAEFLGRLMARLGVEEGRAKAAIANSGPTQARAKLVKDGSGAHVEVEEGFDRAWRRVGLALDRVGFTVEDRDRTQGLYFVRYVDQNEDAKSKTENKGFFARLFTFGSSDDKAKQAQRYRVSVKGDNSASRIAVLNNEGRQEGSQSADKILALLNEQLK